MTEPKTRPTKASVSAFVAAIGDGKRRAQCEFVLEMMRTVTQCEPVMWGANIVGFGAYHYRYASGREGDWFLVGFSPRRANLTLYVMDGLSRHQELLAVLGKHKTGKSCLYVRDLADIDTNVLRAVVVSSVRHMKTIYA